MSPSLSKIQLLVVEQLANSRERDLLVSAGAGSGKTTILVASVLAALKAGVPLERILVVTFTDKAAAEMKNKIYRELGSHEDLAHLRLRLPQAWMSTIHSFCTRLLRERFQAAGVDPRFRILSEEDAKLLLADATTKVFHAHYEKVRTNPDLPFGHLVEMCGFGADGENLRAVIGDLLAYARTSEDPERFLAGHRAQLLRFSRAGANPSWDELPWKDDFAARSARAWRAAAGLLRALVAEIGDTPAWANWLRAIESIDAGLLSTPEGQRSAMAQMAALRLIADPTIFKVRLPNLPRGAGKEIRPLREAANDAFKDTWITGMPVDEERVLTDERASEWLGVPLVALADEVAQSYDEAKSRTGRLDFEDLQIKALRLIEESAAAGSAIRFERVFIDEFQDVNGLQHRILEQVCDPSRIFRVGDVKQSIYQFRLAEPGIIRGLGRDRPLVEENERVPEEAPEWNVLLPRNHRSLPPVLRVVNAVAGSLFFEEEIGTEYGKQALVAGPDTPSVGPGVELILVRGGKDAGADAQDGADEEDSDGNVEGREPEVAASDPREAEWSAIAARIRELVRPGSQVRDPATRELRQTAYSDIAILLRAHTRAPSLARRLEEEGIPCSVSTGESFFDAAEVRDLTSVLGAIDNMLDDIALASALRSPAFGWEDAELLAIRLSYPRARHLAYALACLADRASGGGRFTNALLPDEEEFRAALCGEPADLPDTPPFATIPEKARLALDRFLSWREAAGSSELPDLVSRVLEDSGLARSAASLPGGLRRRANLRKFGGIARRYSTEAGHSLNRFMRWLELLKAGGAKVFEAPVSSESLPAVRILSIHKAKGLEFPIVIVAEMGRKYRLGSRTSAIAPGRRYLGVRLLDTESYILRRPIPLRLLLDAARSDDLAEEKRVLYVAMTRARDLLILSGVMNAQTTIPETLHRAFRRAIDARDATGKAAVEALLNKKPFPLAWLAYALPPIPDEDGPVGDLPLTVRWIRPEPRIELPPAANRIREIEPLLLARERVEVPGGVDTDAIALVDACAKRPRLPSPGMLPSARGKLWATEFKSGREEAVSVRPEDATEESPDEPAVPLIAREEAAREGTLLHAALERLDLPGLSAENLESRVAAAAAAVGGLPEDTAGVLARGLSRLLDLPVGQLIASESEVHREVAFSLRVPLLEITGSLPELRGEILASDEWREWVEEDGTGALRIRGTMPPEAGAPWVLVQGRIDAVLRGPSGWIVLDWKSDRVFGTDAVEARVERYRGQMEIYARAARALFGSPVEAMVFFLRPGILREVK